MNRISTTRRKFLVAAITFSTVAVGTRGLWLGSSRAWAGSTDSPDPLLTRLARQLFPHDGISDSVYASAMGAVLAAAAGDTAMTNTLQSAVAAFDSGRDKPWLTLDEPEQVSVMRELQGEAFFTAVVNTVRWHFYNHPAVWKHLGYPGSSREYGGYINRGFNDIDWLPEDDG